MKQSYSTFASWTLCCLFLLFGQQIFAQDGVPLIFQGLDHATMQSAASRASGGITIGVKNDASLMFANPTTLLSLQGIQFSVGGMQQSIYTKQDQEYGTIQSYTDFNLLMESMTGAIPPMDTTYLNPKIRRRTATQGDSVQRPFGADTLTMPNWNKSKSKSLPLQAFIAAPLSLGKIKFVVGLGAVEYANLNWYYRNNNTLSPNVLDVAKYGTVLTSTLPVADSVATATRQPYYVQWYQSIQQRDGSIYGFGGSIAAALSKRFSLGISAMVLSGSSTDYEENIGRGRIAFYSASLRLGMQGVTHSIKTGTSDYSGLEATISGKYDSRYVSFGFSLKPPSTITRKFTGNLWKDSVSATKVYDGRSDSVHVVTSVSINSEDKMALPWRGTLGVAIAISENMMLGVEYELRAYDAAVYTSPSGATSNPWISSTVIRCGAEYRPLTWLSLRSGIRQDAEVFQPTNSALRAEVVRYPVYSLGCGVILANARLNIAYEYSDRRYIDTWSNSASINQQITNNVVASISYELP